MNDYVKGFLKKIAGLLAVIASLAFIIIGYGSASYSGLGMMIAGLAGVLLVLYIYNKPFQ